MGSSHQIWGMNPQCTTSSRIGWLLKPSSLLDFTSRFNWSQIKECKTGNMAAPVSHDLEGHVIWETWYFHKFTFNKTFNASILLYQEHKSYERHALLYRSSSPLLDGWNHLQWIGYHRQKRTAQGLLLPASYAKRKQIHTFRNPPMLWAKGV
jgi:hypothetical protein